ncbi:MAG: dihydrofolate reductase family protein [Bacteroidales bacterium]|nr:dihydrofolate reductase family protein [Bacteroidales bacterium]
MRPYIICHMIASLDGRIDCDMIEKISGNEYDTALNALNCPSIIEGKTTLVVHYADKGTYEYKDKTPIGKPCYWKSPTVEALLQKDEEPALWFGVDTLGTLLWSINESDGTPLVMILSELAPVEYLDYLRSKEISYIVCGKDGIDLKQVVKMMYEHFAIRRLAVVGGGHLNASFLNEGLLDEVSMQFAPGIDGREGWAATFDGLAQDTKPRLLKLIHVERLEGTDTVWMRYKV